MYPFSARVHYWNSLEEDEAVENFVSFALTFTHAMQIIENNYGKDLLDVSITLWEEADGFIVSDETLEALKKDMYM